MRQLDGTPWIITTAALTAPESSAPAVSSNKRTSLVVANCCELRIPLLHCLIDKEELPLHRRLAIIAIRRLVPSPLVETDDKRTAIVLSSASPPARRFFCNLRTERARCQA